MGLRCCAWTFLLAVSGGYSLLWCAGFSLQWLLLLQSTASRCSGSVVVARGLSSCGSWAPEHRLSSCGTRASLLHGMWDLPGPGLEPMSPALAGGFLTAAPPGKPQVLLKYPLSVKHKVMFLVEFTFWLKFKAQTKNKQKIK